MLKIDQQKIEEVLERWADKIYPSKEEFLRTLKSKRLVFYHGVDPTAPQLHLGHSTNYLLLRKLQDMGHKIILLIGDFTAQVGDPTGKSATRKALSEKEVKQNYKTYKEQAGKILDFKSFKNPVKVEFNSKWLAKMNLTDVMKLLSNVTHAQITQRSMFKERERNNTDLYMHELLYPVLQGYDSVAMDVDAEVGGVDQTFNMLIGRDLVKIYNKKEKFVVTTPLLENPKTGKKLMSKSEGGFVALNDLPAEMYGKIMALADEAIIPCFKFCTEVPIENVNKIEENLKTNSTNPRDIKAMLAKEIVKMYHGEKEAQSAEDEFNKVHRDKELPSEIEAFETDKKIYPILDLLFDSKLASSKNEAKRLVEGGGVAIIKNGREERVADWKQQIEIENEMVVQAGKRRFVKIKMK